MNSWLRVVHILGVIFWIGGAVTVAWIATAIGGDNKESSSTGLSQVARSAALRIATPGMVLAWVGGLILLATHWSTYARAGWMHGKITVALIVAALTGVLSGKLRKAAQGEPVSVGTLRGLGWAIALLAVLNVVLALVGPSLMGG